MYSCHSVLKCYDLFSGVKVSIRSFRQLFVEISTSLYPTSQFPTKLECLISGHNLFHAKSFWNLLGISINWRGGVFIEAIYKCTL